MIITQEMLSEAKSVGGRYNRLAMQVHNYGFMLNTGLTIGHLSAHQLKLDTGDILPALPLDLVKQFNISIQESTRKPIIPKFAKTAVHPHCAIEIKTSLDLIQIEKLLAVSFYFDVLLVSLPLLLCLKEMEIREYFPSIYSFKSTKDTERLPINDKIIDTNTFIV